MQNYNNTGALNYTSPLLHHVRITGLQPSATYFYSECLLGACCWPGSLPADDGSMLSISSQQHYHQQHYYHLQAACCR